ncbi:MAG TPA: poly-gamma-glutamate synthase PgsB, partial [Terriglobales bacterium]|nr:poly-gamma-glutamate synthase PgsB [Terriglobales bacterium]
RARRRVPLRIAVTGTRGKSGVTRLIAAGLRESGRRVLAKTTGSVPALILHDGSERPIERPGAPSIREQVRLVERAARLGADALVTELMSIGAECLSAESRAIVRPGLLALTNVRLDHLEAMGGTKEAIAGTLAAAFPDEATVFVPAEEARPVFRETAAARRSRLVEAGGPPVGGDDLPPGEFEPNLRLALAVLERVGVDRATALRGIGRARPDPGGLKVWRAAFGRPPRSAFLVSAFAANDPESSAAAMERVGQLLPPADRRRAGLLCLREDRGDRTLQWARAAAGGFFDGFASVAVVGPPAPAARRVFRRALGGRFGTFSFDAAPDPATLTGRLVASAVEGAATGSGGAVVVGLGNFVGWGERFVRSWSETGTLHGR